MHIAACQTDHVAPYVCAVRSVQYAVLTRPGTDRNRNVYSGSQHAPKIVRDAHHSENVALKAIGGLAAAALLLAPQVSLAAARLPPVDSGE